MDPNPAGILLHDGADGNSDRQGDDTRDGREGEVVWRDNPRRFPFRFLREAVVRCGSRTREPGRGAVRGGRVVAHEVLPPGAAPDDDGRLPRRVWWLKLSEFPNGCPAAEGVPIARLLGVRSN